MRQPSLSPSEQPRLSSSEQILINMGFVETLEFAQKMQIPLDEVQDLVYLILESRLKNSVSNEKIYIERMKQKLFQKQHSTVIILGGLLFSTARFLFDDSFDILSFLLYGGTGSILGSLFFIFKTSPNQIKLAEHVKNDLLALDQKQMKNLEQMKSQFIEFNKFRTADENNLI